MQRLLYDQNNAEAANKRHEVTENFHGGESEQMKQRHQQIIISSKSLAPHDHNIDVERLQALRDLYDH